MSEILDRANKAKAVLDSPAFQDAFTAVRNAIIDRIEKCPRSDAQTAEYLRQCLHLLSDVRLNMVTAVNSGKLDAFRLAEDEKRKRSPLRNLFR